MTQMSQIEKQNFLSQPHIGVLALNNPGQGPLTTPLWYTYSAAGEISFIIAGNSRKAQLLQVGARASLMAQEEKLPYSYVSVEGSVTAIEPATFDDLLAMAQRYLGAEQGQQYADASNLAEQVRVRLAPEHWLAVDYAKRSH